MRALVLVIPPWDSTVTAIFNSLWQFNQPPDIIAIMPTDVLRQQQAILQYLQTGRHDPVHSEWPGSVMPRCIHADSVMRAALVAEIVSRTKNLPAPNVAIPSNLQAFTRAKIEPMVRGLFPSAEQRAVLEMLDDSVVFLTPDTIQHALHRKGLWLGTAWNVANIFLVSMGAEPLSGDARLIVGLSSDTTCYVSFEYFAETDCFADFVVHEIAHVFHNCRRESCDAEPKDDLDCIQICLHNCIQMVWYENCK
jgi:hypothetical protein